MNVTFIPGFCGTELHDNLGLRPLVGSKVWVDYARIGSGALSYLDLANDGTSPGPMCPAGVTVRAGEPEPGEYSSLISALRDAGHKVQPLGWDWRLNMLTAGDRAGASMLAQWGDGPVWIVAHSAGGLVARGAVQHYYDHGKGSFIKGIIYLGCPYFGTYYPIAVVARQAEMYRNLAWLMGKGVSKGQNAGQIVLDTLIPHLVALWQLLPCYGYGPLWDQNPTRVEWMYKASFYSDVNAGMLQVRLNTAKDFWAAMKTMQWREKEFFIAGDKFKTPVDFSWSEPGDKLLKAEYSQLGDNTVDYASAVPADAQAVASSTAWGHELMPNIRDLQTTIMDYLP